MLLFDRSVKCVVMTGSHSYTFTDLHMDFEIELTRSSKDLNNATITIFNLSEKTRKEISSDFKGLEIHAGYQMKPALLFLGTAIEVLHEKEKSDWKTTIKAVDGGESFYGKKFNKSYSKGTPVSTILNDLFSSLDLPFELSTIVTKSLLSSQSYSGKTKSILDLLCNQYGLKWSIQRGVIEIQEKGQIPLSAYKKVTLLAPDTGLIGSPKIVEVEKETKGTKKKVAGLTATSLINPDLRPSRLVSLAPVNPASIVGFTMVKNRKKKAFDITAKGIFVIDTVRIKGSNYAQSFYCDLECESL